SADDPEVRLTGAASDELIALVAGWKGDVPAVGRSILTAPRQVRFAEVYQDSGLIAGARAVVTGDWLGLSLVTVVPEARRRGLGRLLVRRLAGWAAQAGATRAYLQVESGNAPAIALYERLGFTTHHTYITWRYEAG